MQKKIHLFGDSVFRGWALGTFDPDPSHPLYDFRSIANMANLVLAENGIKDEFVYTDIRGVNLGFDVAEQAALVRAMLADGTIRAGDVVVMEDAGPHHEDPDIYQARWEAMRAAVVDKYDVLLITMTTPDYPPAPADSQYDLVIGARSMNDAIVAASTVEMTGPGLTLCADMNGVMDYETTSGLYASVPFYHTDGIHPNVWGQARFVGVILDYCRYLPLLSTCATAKALAAANYAALDYGSGIMTAAMAEEMTEYLLLGIPAVVVEEDSVIDGYDIENANAAASTYGVVQISRGQTITLAEDTRISKIEFALSKVGNPTGPLNVDFYAVTGTVGVDAVPTGASLKTASIDVSTLTGTAQWVAFDVDPFVAPAGGLAFALSYSGGDIDNRPNVWVDTSEPTHAGSYVKNDGTWEANPGYDMIFRLTGRPA